MGERPTLILTTRLGVRPLGVRGDPLHAVADQLLAVIRRRLGDGPANLLAEPQLRELGDGIDWYATQSGDVRRFSELSDAERAETLRTIESQLEAIRGLGRQLEASNTSDEARLIGRSLQLATRRPSDDFILPGRWPAGDRGLGLRGRCRSEPAGLRAAAAARRRTSARRRPRQRAGHRAAGTPRLVALAGRVAVRTAAPAAAADGVVAAARLRSGRSRAECRHARSGGAAPAAATARSDAGAEGLARRCAGRRDRS